MSPTERERCSEPEVLFGAEVRQKALCMGLSTSKHLKLVTLSVSV